MQKFQKAVPATLKINNTYTYTYTYTDQEETFERQLCATSI